MSDYLVIPPEGSPQVWRGLSAPPTANQVPANSQILVLPDGYTQAQIPYMQSDGNGNAVYVAPTPPTPLPPGPNVGGFLQAVQSDSLTTANNGVLLFQLGGLLAVFQADMQGMALTGSATPLQTHWQNAIANFGSTWLTSNVQTMLTGYASTYNIPLVAQ